MKKKFYYLIFILIVNLNLNILYANDIKEFEIEGISIGDSTLDFFNKDEIKKEKEDEYKYKHTFATIGFTRNFENYETVQIDYKINDKNFKIYGITGVIYFDDNFNNCLKKKNEIVSELKTSFRNIESRDENKNHWADKTGNSKTYSTYFEFKSGGYISVSCYDWSVKKNKEKGWYDNLKVGIISQEFQDFLVKTYEN